MYKRGGHQTEVLYKVWYRESKTKEYNRKRGSSSGRGCGWNGEVHGRRQACISRRSRKSNLFLQEDVEKEIVQQGKKHDREVTIEEGK